MKIVNTFCQKVMASTLVACLSVSSSLDTASATTNCVFAPGTKKMTLQGPCSTDSAIVIPDGFTLDGQGFKITAIDPPAGNFTGAILTNAGKAAHITNIFLRTNLADVCNTGLDKVAGIRYINGGGNVLSVNILINKGAGTSVCEEGVAVEAIDLPFATTKPYRKLSVKNSTLNNNQLAAVVGVGNVNIRIEANLIKNLDGFPVPQRGIELADGAKGYVLTNEILRHRNTAVGGTPSYGIFLNRSASVTLFTNTLNFNDVAIRATGTNKSTVRSNYIRSSTFDGILVDDEAGPTASNTIWQNDSGKNGQHGVNFQDFNNTLTKNTVKVNLCERNIQNGINMEGKINKIQMNTTSLNDGLDIADFGAGTIVERTANIYTRNVCSTSTGAPVDCPVVP